MIFRSLAILPSVGLFFYRGLLEEWQLFGPVEDRPRRFA
jgi:hypothetical protein